MFCTRPTGAGGGPAGAAGFRQTVPGMETTEFVAQADRTSIVFPFINECVPTVEFNTQVEEGMHHINHVDNVVVIVYILRTRRRAKS